MNPWALVAQIGFALGMYAFNRWIATKPPAATANDYLNDYPTATEGDPVPIVIGTVRVRNPVFMWYGGVTSRSPITSSNSGIFGTGLGGGSIGAPDGSAVMYGANMLLNVGIPMGPPQPGSAMSTRLVGMWMADVKTIDGGSAINLADGQSTRTANSNPGIGDLFGAPGGGTSNPWGAIGLISFYGGGNDQVLTNGVMPGTHAENDVPRPFGWVTDITPIATFMRGVGDPTTSAAPGQLIDATQIPGFRNQMLVALTGDVSWQTFADDGPGVWDAFYLGANAQVPPFSFELQVRRNTQFNAGWLALPDADPTTVIYDLLTGDWGKVGYDPARIDLSTFTPASAVLLAEGNGYSRVIDSLRSAKDVLQEIVSQISASLYEDPVDGMVRLKLMRAGDAIVGTYGPDDVVSVEDFTTLFWRDVVNQVRVKYSERTADYADADAVAQNMASAVMQDTMVGDVASAGGNINSITVEYPGCCTFANAQNLAARDLMLLSQPLAQLKVTFTRKARGLRPGDLITMNFPDYWMTNVVFRVISVDLGMPGATQVQVTLTQDAYAAGGAVASGTSLPPPFALAKPSPVTVRKIIECPRWLMQYAITSGVITGSADLQRMLAMGLPDDAATSYQTQSLPAIALLLGFGTYALDVRQTNASTLAAKVHTAYPQELAPYDTTTGLVVDSLPVSANVGNLATSVWTNAIIKAAGTSLLLVGDEVMAYESAVDLSGTGAGPWQLINIWRGLLDTAARDHAVGERVFWIGISFHGMKQVGTVGKPDSGGSPLVQMNARLGGATGSGEDPLDLLTVTGRHAKPLPVANFRVCGEAMSGTQPTPTVSNGVVPPTGFAGFFAKVSAMEEGFGVAYQKRARVTSTIYRGDELDNTDPEASVLEVWAQKTATVPGQAAGAELALNIAGTAGARSQLLLGGVGYGDIDIIAHSAFTTGSTLAPPIVRVTEFQAPKVHVVAPRWRNLFGDARWLAAGVGGPGAPCWQVATGVIATTAAGVSPTRIAGELIVTTVGKPANGSAVQTVDVRGYNPKGMVAFVDVYAKDTSPNLATLVILTEALDAAAATVLGSSTTTFAAGTIPAIWAIKSTSLAPLPVGTSFVRVTYTLTSPNAGEVSISTPRVRLGLPLSSLLTNGGFESGSTTGWTNVVGSFVINPGSVQGPSANYAGGGAFAAALIREDISISTGWEVGSDAVLDFWRATHIAGDTGSVTMYFLNSGGAAVGPAFSTGNTTNATLDVWTHVKLSAPVPEGAVTIRVDVQANRAAGSGNSGALFDGFELTQWKDLSDARSYTLFDYSKPTTQPIAATWQEWHVEHGDLYRAGVPHPIVFGGGQASRDGGGLQTTLAMTWSDGLTHATGVAVGQWGGAKNVLDASPVVAIDSYVFKRGGVAFQGIDSDNVYRVAAPDGSKSFTALVLLRVDEDSYSAACGLFGRRSATGWQLELDATGHVTSTLVGATGSATATRAGSTVADGAWHLAAVVYNQAAATLTVYDERGASASASTAGIGSLANTDWASLLYLGKSRLTVDSLPGMIARAYWFDAALTSAQVAAHWNYAKDPTGLAPTLTCPSAGWIPGAKDVSGNETLVCVAADQVGLGYSATTNGYGLVVSPAVTNKIPSWDFTGGSWAAGSGTTLTQGIVDATGQATGVAVLDATGGGIAVSGIVLTASAAKTLVLWARSDAATTLDFVLKNSAGVVKQTLVRAVGVGWQRVVVNFTTWDASTANGIVQIRAHGGAGSAVPFYLTRVVHLEDGVSCGAYIPRLPASATSGDTFATLTATQVAQLNAEGEIEALGVGACASPLGTLAAVNNGTFAQMRDLACDSSQHPVLNHWDSASANVPSQASATDWSTAFDVRGRWSYTGLLDNARASVITAGVVALSGTVYGRTATFAYTATKATRIQVGTGPSGTFSGFLSRVVVRAREEILP